MRGKIERKQWNVREGKEKDLREGLIVREGSGLRQVGDVATETILSPTAVRGVSCVEWGLPFLSLYNFDDHSRHFTPWLLVVRDLWSC